MDEDLVVKTSTMECGCGFKVTSDPESAMAAYNEHECATEIPWYVTVLEAVFSLWGFIVISLICALIAVIVTHGKVGGSWF